MILRLLPRPLKCLCPTILPKTRKGFFFARWTIGGISNLSIKNFKNPWGKKFSIPSRNADNSKRSGSPVWMQRVRDNEVWRRHPALQIQFLVAEYFGSHEIKRLRVLQISKDSRRRQSRRVVAHSPVCGIRSWHGYACKEVKTKELLNFIERLETNEAKEYLQALKADEFGIHR